MEKVALVTGSSSGIGYETALALARDNYFTFASMRFRIPPGCLGFGDPFKFCVRFGLLILCVKIVSSSRTLLLLTKGDNQ